MASSTRVRLLYLVMSLSSNKFLNSFREAASWATQATAFVMRIFSDLISSNLDPYLAGLPVSLYIFFITTQHRSAHGGAMIIMPAERR